MTLFPELFAALTRAFEGKLVRQKSKGKAGGSFDYVTARTVMNRLDYVLGPENWWDAYSPAGDHSVFCHLTIRLPDGTTLTKTDAGGSAGMADQGDDDKSAVSDAFKRAAAKFGIGRHLYGEGQVNFEAQAKTQAKKAAKALARPAIKALPAPTGTGDPPPQRWLPRDGRELVAWLVDQEDEFEVKVAPDLLLWARRKSYHGPIAGWTEEQAIAGLREAERLISLAVAARTEAVAS